jgi:hypothetical protein
MIKLTKQEIFDLRPSKGLCLIQPLRAVDEINVGKKKLYFDPSFNQNENAPVSGIVISCNQDPYWNHNNHWSEPDLLPGDIVVFSYHEGSKFTHPVLEQTIICKETNELFFFIQYAECYCAKRGETRFGLNHYHICRPIKKAVNVGIELPEHMKTKNSLSVAEVLFPPLRETRYKAPISPGTLAQSGQYIVFDHNADCPLEYDIHRSFLDKTELVAIPQRDITAIVDNPDTITS